MCILEWFGLKKMTKSIAILDATVEVLPRDDSDELIGDLEDARKNIKELGNIGMSAVKDVAELAYQSQHDRLYLALSSMMKSTLETQRELIETHRSRQELTGSNATPDQITNNLFVGSTSELLDLLEKDRKKD